MSIDTAPRFYRTPTDLTGNPDDDIGFPGVFPFTRGIQPTMYRGRPWTMRQYAGFATAAESNQRYRYLLSKGVSGLSVAFDLPTQIGYDSDHALAAGEVGKVGVAIDSIEDMAALFEGIPLDRVSTSMTINATAIILLALYVAVAKRQGVAPGALSGTVQNDILKEYVARGTYIYPPRPSLRIVTDIIAFCERELPQWNTISISGYHIREAGSTAVQEVAFTFAHASAYVQSAIDAGLDVNAFGQRISFFFNAHNDFLEEIAKYRAARRLWARRMKDRFGATNPGTQSLHGNGKDEALALPTEESATVALRTQQIILHESGVANTVDPVGGSYAIEEMTSRIEREASDLLDRIDRLGGTLAAIETGYIQRQIQDAAYRAQQAIDAGDAVVVGVNRFTDDQGGARHATIFRIDPEMERRQIERVRAVRAGRSESEWRAAVDAVESAARSGANLVPPIVAAVEKRATLGEIADAMRHVFGEHQDVSA